jgi:hypothetical protein
MSDTEEIVRLRARVAELEAAQSAQVDVGQRRGRPTDRGSAWRATASAVLLTLACVLAALSVTSVWASTVLSDTDQYVETVAPVADDPAVQAAIADEVTVAIMDNLDIEQLTAEALGVLAEQDNMPPRVADALPALSVPLSQGIESFTHSQAERLLASPAFATVWEEVNRIAHTQVVALLEGNEGGAVSAQDDAITLNLAPIIEQVKERLVAQGFELADRIPEIDKSFVLVQSEAVGRAQRVYVLLNTLGTWLPFVAVGVFALGVYAARNRRRALLRGSLGVVAAMVVLGAGLALARTYYVETTPADILTAQSAGNVFDTLVRFLRSALRAVGVLFLLLALAAFVTGPSAGAVRARGSVQRGLGSVRGSAEAAGWQTGPVGTWIYAHRGALRVTTFLAAGLALMFWTQPTAGVVVAVAGVVVLVLLLIELLGRPPAAPRPA